MRLLTPAIALAASALLGCNSLLGIEEVRGSGAGAGAASSDGGGATTGLGGGGATGAAAGGAGGAGGNGSRCKDNVVADGELCLLQLEMIPTNVPQASDFALLDCDEDGDLDVAVAHAGGGVVVLKNEGSSFDTVGGPLASGETVLAIAAIEHPARPDHRSLVLAKANKFLQLMTGNGNCTFGAEPSFQASDSTHDIAVASFGGTERAVVALGLGLCTINDTADACVDFATGGNPRRLAAGDVNGDGDDDVAYVDVANLDKVGLVAGNASGLDAVLQPYSDPAITSYRAVAIGDIVDDARSPGLEVAAIGGGIDMVFLLGDDPAYPDFLGSYALDGNDGVDLALGDLNHDGRLDVVTANGADKSLSLLLGDGSALAPAGAPWPFQTEGPEPVAIAVADLDGALDGNDALDVIALLDGGLAPNLVLIRAEP